jgi:hypothetical protein
MCYPWCDRAIGPIIPDQSIVRRIGKERFPSWSQAGGRSGGRCRCRTAGKRTPAETLDGDIIWHRPIVGADLTGPGFVADTVGRAASELAEGSGF